MEQWTADIERALAEMGISAPREACALLAGHLDAVYATNEVLNLTAIPREQAVAMHVADSAAALSAVASAPPGPMCDLGSGAGFPGIPLCVLSGRETVLVESIKKKAAFLERVVADLRLKATVQGIRAEELALSERGGFAVVTARALSSLPSLCELAAPLLDSRGLLVCLKGRSEAEELRRGEAAAGIAGLRLVDATSTTVPGVDGARTIVIFERIGQPRMRLPRRPGMAQRHPLA